MSDHSHIQWTDATWNPVRGCVKVSPGCAHCYAETFAERFRGVPGHPYEHGFDLRLVPEKLHEPLSWKKPRRVFVNSMSDLFQDGVPDSYIDQVFAVMALAPQHTFQVLTKRAERMREYFNNSAPLANGRVVRRFTDLMIQRHLGAVTWPGWPLPNVWLGVSVENQHFADERIPLLLQTSAAVRFISAEPLLGPVDISDYLEPICDCSKFDSIGSGAFHDESCPAGGGSLDWVICGGESGAGSRPFEVNWARSIVQQCARQPRVPVFVKQLGANVRDRNDAGFEGDTPRSWPMDTDVEDYPNGFREDYQGAPVRIRLRKKGGDINEWPADLRVREFPEAPP